MPKEQSLKICPESNTKTMTELGALLSAVPQALLLKKGIGAFSSISIQPWNVLKKATTASVFLGVNAFRFEEVARPRAGAGEAVIRITLTTICGTDLHIVRGEYPVQSGLIIGHEPVGVIEALGRRF